MLFTLKKTNLQNSQLPSRAWLIFVPVKTPALCKNSLSSLHVRTCRNRCALDDRLCCQLQFLQMTKMEYTLSSDDITGFSPEDGF